MLPFVHIGPYAQPTYGLMMLIAIAVAALMLDRAFKREHLKIDAVLMVTIAATAGVVGSTIWHLALDSPGGPSVLSWRALWHRGGFSGFGGLVFGAGVLALQGWRAKIGAVRTLDLAAPAMAIGQALARVGCFLSGDGCYGIAIKPVEILGFTFTPWGMSFPHGIVPVLVPVYPTPLYEMAIGIAIGALLWWRLAKPHGTGTIVGRYLILAGTARFFIEFIRRNPKILWGLSNQQLLCAGAVLVGVALIWKASRRPELRSAESQGTPITFTQER